ncbi:uncharacterized protein V1516DRAFT_624357 [Lipomyces oligophaga]|uniref:uncharacterized protein n=1 Tax=Lipomyces oligophaga TaxID=45792 RepID=UPI0034CF58C8
MPPSKEPAASTPKTDGSNEEVQTKRIAVTKEVVIEKTIEVPVSPKTAQPINIIAGKGYSKQGELISVECMKRDIEHGEHITDEETGRLVYQSFPICRETGKPLSFRYNVDHDKPFQCTFFVPDETYHLLQLYIHQDAPLSCQVPARSQSEGIYAPLIFSMQGRLENSHLDIATKFNAIFEYAETAHGGVNITSAVAYPVHPENTSRIIIGDEVTFEFTSRWFDVTRSPKHSDRRVASFSTFFYCLCSAGVAFLIAAFYFLAIVFPKRVRSRSALKHSLSVSGAPDFSIFMGNGAFSGSKRD